MNVKELTSRLPSHLRLVFGAWCAGVALSDFIAARSLAWHRVEILAVLGDGFDVALPCGTGVPAVTAAAVVSASPSAVSASSVSASDVGTVLTPSASTRSDKPRIDTSPATLSTTPPHRGQHCTLLIAGYDNQIGGLNDT